MSDHIRGKQFEEAGGVEDWRALWGGAFASTYFETGSFSAGVELVRAISELPAAADHHVDVDLRSEGVTVRVFTHEPGGLSSDDVELARQISALATRVGVRAVPSIVRHVQVNIDALEIPKLQPFWAAVLGYDAFGDEDVFDPYRVGPPFTFQQMDAPRPQRNRIHIDVYVPRDQVEARIAAALAAGGHMVNDSHAPNWWTLADAEGNEVDLAIWG